MSIKTQSDNLIRMMGIDSKVMNAPLTFVEDLALDSRNSDTMFVTIGIVGHNTHCRYIKFPVSLSYMGLRWKDEFEFEFSKDIQRDMNTFIDKYHREPTPEEYKELTERHLYRC